jgi:PAS domain S-box-containing protein
VKSGARWRSRMHGVLAHPSVRFGLTGVAAVVVVSYASYSYRAIDRQLTRRALSDRQVAAQGAAATLAEEFDRAKAGAVSLVAPVQIRRLLARGRWFEAARRLEAKAGSLQGFEGLFVLDVHGIVRADLPARRGFRGTSLAQRPWFQEVSRVPQPSVTALAAGESGPGDDRFAVCVPVRRRTGAVAGYLVLRLRMGSLGSWARTASVAPTGSVRIYDPQKRLVFDSRYGAGSGADRGARTLAEEPGGRDPGSSLTYDPVAQGQVIVSHASVPTYGWTFVARQPASAGLRERDRELRGLLVGYGLILLLGAVVAYLSWRLASEKKQQEDSERFATVLDATAEAIICVDDQQRIIQFNRGAEEIFGYTAAEIIDQPLDRLLPERFRLDHRQHVQQFSHHSSSSRPFAKRPELVGLRKDGTEFPAIISISRSLSHGRMTLTAILSDVTERKQAEKALEEKEHLLTAVGAMAHVGGWEFDTRTGRGTWTEEVARIHDMDPADTTSAEIGMDFYHGDSREQIEAAIGAAIENGVPYDLELEMVTAKGNRKWVRTIGEPLIENGAVVKLRGSFQDISERRLVEEKIQSLNAELEKKVAARTAELEAANGELEAFSYSVSHDLRAPLRSIDGFSQALLEDYTDNLDEQGRDYLTRVRAATVRMAELIDDLLQLSRVTRSKLEREPVDLAALAQAIVAELRRAEPERKVVVEIADPLVVDGDRNLIRIALENLIGNAWKFTGPKAGARIEVGAHLRDGEASYFVRDNGVGFDMSYADKLFGAFQRLHPATDFPGTGIGLATVQRIVHRHGGRVWVEAAVDRGAEFRFTLHDIH